MVSLDSPLLEEMACLLLSGYQKTRLTPQHILTSSCVMHAMQHRTLYMSFVHFASKRQQQNITLVHSSGRGTQHRVSVPARANSKTLHYCIVMKERQSTGYTSM